MVLLMNGCAIYAVNPGTKPMENAGFGVMSALTRLSSPGKSYTPISFPGVMSLVFVVQGKNTNIAA